MTQSFQFQLDEPTEVGTARRKTAAVAQQLGFGEPDVGRLNIAVTELAKNILKHASRGQLFVRSLAPEGITGIEVLSVDKGPGMQDISRCMADGYSTAGSPGTGLGAVSRLSNLFDIYSAPGQGTVVLARFWPQEPVAAKVPPAVGCICIPAHEHDECGDDWAIHADADAMKVLVVDGLGHGPLAATAAAQAVRVFRENSQRNPRLIIDQMHGALRSTRGASLAIAEVRFPEQQIIYAGIGNISASILEASTSRSMVSHNGTVGHECHKIAEFIYPWNPGAALVMHSDGLQSRWRLQLYPGLLQRHPSVIAAVLFRDFRRGHDDATALVMRIQR